ncbi:hypothetical protein [Nocardioides plantarum]|uniref:Uncharacterized protein n=1 Tax=Nocardioides plantarum TaxID=29299 RepID=A0ABV5K8S7_9ACTN|nr:hypothetical protein [Nocardioides plantarum]
MSLRRSAQGAGGWLLTAAGVIAIVVVTTGDHRFSQVGGVVVAVAAGLSVLAPFAVGAAYLAIRRRNRTKESAADGVPVSPRARALQTSLASMLDRVDETDDVLGLHRVVRGDRLELTATALREIDDPWEALSFIWFVRPSQPADFPQSARFHGLPGWAQDAVVLLDLRRELQLRGAASALADGPGFYRHGFTRIGEAASRTGSRELVDTLLDARHASAKGDDPGDPVRQRLLALLDDPASWTQLLASSD